MNKRKEVEKNTNFTGSVSLEKKHTHKYDSFVYEYMYACNAFTLLLLLNWITLWIDRWDFQHIKDCERDEIKERQWRRNNNTTHTDE